MAMGAHVARRQAVEENVVDQLRPEIKIGEQVVAAREYEAVVASAAALVRLPVRKPTAFTDTVSERSS